MVLKNKIQKTYTSMIWIVSFFLFSYLIVKFAIPKSIYMVGEFPYPTEYYSMKKMLIVFISTFVMFVLFHLYCNFFITKMNETCTNIIMAVLLIFILATEIIVTTIAMFPIKGDYMILKDGIIAFFEGKKEFPYMNQFEFYPYNTHIRLIGGYFSKLIGNVKIGLKILPIFTITGSIIINTLIVKKITDYKLAHISMVMSLLNIFIYWQAPVFYTHTLVVIFLSATLYAYLDVKSSKSKGKKGICLFAFGFFSACTYIIRPTAASITIAILIENTFRYRKGHSVNIISSILLCMLLIVGFMNLLTVTNLSTDNNGLKMPYSHWVKMGLNEQRYGVWNNEDVSYSEDIIYSTKEKDEFNKTIIIQRLKDFGLKGYLKHLDEKVERFWVSSQFSSYRIGEWFKQRNNMVFDIVANYDSNYYKAFNLYSFIIKLFIYLGIFVTIIFYKTFNENESEILRICWMSTIIVFVFLLAWETAPHYTYEAFALLNIPASMGFYKLWGLLGKRFKN